jgi:hypothetical protein
MKRAYSNTPVTIALITAIFGVAVASSMALEFSTLNMALGQGTAPPQSSTLTPAERAMCDPNNPGLAFVNTTESKICGLPKSTPSSNATTTTPPTTTSSSPSATPP